MRIEILGVDAETATLQLLFIEGKLTVEMEAKISSQSIAVIERARTLVKEAHDELANEECQRN